LSNYFVKTTKLSSSCKELTDIMKKMKQLKFALWMLGQSHEGLNSRLQ